MKKISIALSGSGFLAPILAGSICSILDLKIAITEIAGTSGGSIVAALVAMGLSSDQIKQIALSKLPSGIASIEYFAVFSQGLNKGNILHSWLKSIMGSTTFKTAKIPVTIMATDINKGHSVEFSVETTPDVLLADACRASASVPFFYTPFILEGVKLVDGGMCCNIPVDKLTVNSTKRIGIEVIDGTPVGNTDSLLDLAKQSVSTMLSSNEDNLIAWGKQTGAEIIPVNAIPYGFLDADLPDVDKMILFNRGYTTVSNKIKQF